MVQADRPQQDGPDGRSTNDVWMPRSVIKDVNLKKKLKQSYRSKPLPPQGLFISSIKPKAPKTPSDTWHHRLPPLPILSPFSAPKQLKYFHSQQSQIPLFTISTNTSISSTQLPNTSPPIAISATISSPKPRRNLVTLVRYLNETTIKCKLQ